MRDRSRTALTLGGLTIGLAMIVALGGVGQHARAAAAGWIADVVPGDARLTSIRPIAADEGVAEPTSTGDVPGVARVSPIATFDVALDGTRTDAAAVVGADLAADGRLTFVAGDRDAALAALDAGGAAIVPASLAARLGLTVGQILRVPTADGGLPRPAGRRHRRAIDPGPQRRVDARRLERRHDRPRRRRRGRLRRPLRARTHPPSARDALRSAAAQLALEVVPLDRIEGAIERRARPGLRTVRRAGGRSPSSSPRSASSTR